MKGSGLFLFLTLIIIVSACTAFRKNLGSSPRHSENIAGLRPTYDNEDIPVQESDTVVENSNPQTGLAPQQDVTEQLDEILGNIIKKNDDIEFITGYTIQVYSGASRENADMVKSEIYRQMPDARPKRDYISPNFIVRVGSFLEKIEAQKTYTKLKAHFPQATLIPARIPNSLPPSK